MPHLVTKRRVLHLAQHLLGPAVVLQHAVSREVGRRLQRSYRQVVPRHTAVATVAREALRGPGHVPRNEEHEARLVGAGVGVAIGVGLGLGLELAPLDQELAARAWVRKIRIRVRGPAHLLRQDVLKAGEGVACSSAVLVRALRVGPHALDVGAKGRLGAPVRVDRVDDLLGQAHVLALPKAGLQRVSSSPVWSAVACPWAVLAREACSSWVFEPCAAYLRVGESLLVDFVSLRSCSFVLYPVLLVVGLHEEAVRPSVLSNEAAHPLAIQVCDDGTVGQMTCAAVVKRGAFGVYSVTTVGPRPPMRVWWREHGGLAGGQSAPSRGAAPSIGSDERVVDLLHVAGALEKPARVRGHR